MFAAGCSDKRFNIGCYDAFNEAFWFGWVFAEPLTVCLAVFASFFALIIFGVSKHEDCVEINVGHVTIFRFVTTDSATSLLRSSI